MNVRNQGNHSMLSTFTSAKANASQFGADKLNLKYQQMEEIIYKPEERQPFHEEDNYKTPQLSIGSPLLNKNQGSLDYQSLVTYINKNFDTCNILGLDHRFSGLKRQLDFTGDPQSSMNFAPRGIINESKDYRCLNTFKKTKYNSEELGQATTEIQLEKDRSHEYVQLPKLDRVFSYRQLNLNQSKESKHVSGRVAFQMEFMGKENPQKLEARKRFCDFEELSQGSTDAESSPFTKKSNELKRFRNNDYQIQEQTFSFSF